MVPALELKEEHAVESPPAEVVAPIPITITPATPAVTSEDVTPRSSTVQAQGDVNGEKRSMSLDEKDRDISRGKKVREVLKDRVHKGQARITTISKKIGHNVGRHSSLNLKRTLSAPGACSVPSQCHQATNILNRFPLRPLAQPISSVFNTSPTIQQHPCVSARPWALGGSASTPCHLT